MEFSFLTLVRVYILIFWKVCYGFINSYILTRREKLFCKRELAEIKVFNSQA